MRLRGAAVAIGTLLASASPAMGCVTVGVYPYNPARALPALHRTVGRGITAVSVYLTAGRPLAQSVIDAANRADATLIVTWEPDGGHDGASQPRFRLTRVAQGRYDASLSRLVGQLQGVRRGAILRPMPEMNTPWYAWSGTVNHNTPAEYVKAWRRVRAAVRSAPGGSNVKLLWAPYAENIPQTRANSFAAYFPGRANVDLVGASGYNFGAQGSLTWTDPDALFAGAYQTIESLAAKPFWLAETGSTADGGDKAGWILALSTLKATMPKLAGMVWYDVNDPTGDFRLRGRSVNSAFRSLLKEACR